MRKLGVLVTVVAALLLTVATPAWADGFKSYRICGGSSFMTCAAVQVNVVGHTVTLRVWNLAQNSAAGHGLGTRTSGASILDGIAFYNIPAGVHVDLASLNTSGPALGGNHPAGWNLRNFGNLAFAVDTRPSTSTGIASGCAPSGQLAGASANVFLNPCSSNFGNTADWVTFSFRITGGSWDPRTSDISVRSHDASTGRYSEYWTGTTPFGQQATTVTVTPEPVTMTLLATGLAGMGGAGIFRRRRKRDPTA